MPPTRRPPLAGATAVRDMQRRGRGLCAPQLVHQAVDAIRRTHQVTSGRVLAVVADSDQDLRAVVRARYDLHQEPVVSDHAVTANQPPTSASSRLGTPSGQSIRSRGVAFAPNSRRNRSTRR